MEDNLKDQVNKTLLGLAKATSPSAANNANTPGYLKQLVFGSEVLDDKKLQALEKMQNDGRWMMVHQLANALLSLIDPTEDPKNGWLQDIQMTVLVPQQIKWSPDGFEVTEL